ncbi:MAG: HDOD domain-containing protein [Leptonema sp. (in: bacteria)]
MEPFKAEIEEKLKNIDRLPSFPKVVHKVLTMIRNPEVEFKDISNEIIKDPGLTSDVIRLSNSAYYHPTHEIRSIEEGIKILGLNTLKEIVLIAAARGILKQPIDGYKLESKEMWEHSIIVGYLSAKISEDLKRSETPKDVCFTAGLMHDCGKLLMASVFKKAIHYINLEYQKNPEANFTDLEKKFIGYTHNELGGILLKNWNFPEDLIDAVINIYHPEASKKNPLLTSIIHISNWIALSAGIGVDAMGMRETLSSFAIQKLNLNDEKLKKYYESIPDYLGILKDLEI